MKGEEEYMKPLWTSDIVREMHLHDITGKELAREAGWSEKYLCAVLNGKRTPKRAEEAVSAALFRVVFKNDLRQAGRECDLVAELERLRTHDPEYAQRLSKALGLEKTED